MRERFRETVARFRELGAELHADDPGLANPIDTWNTIACVDNLASEGPLLATGRVGADARELIEAGAAYSGADYARARNEQAAYAAAFGRFMERYDLFLTPAMEVVAFPHGTTGPASVEGQPIGEHFDDWCHFCYPANLTGAPAISVPMGTAEHGLPVGLQLTGRRLGDATVLRAAAAWERLAPWPRPPLATADVPRGMSLTRRATACAPACASRGADGARGRAPRLPPGGRRARRRDRARRLTGRHRSATPCPPGYSPSATQVLLDLRERHVLARLELALLLEVELARPEQVHDRGHRDPDEHRDVGVARGRGRSGRSTTRTWCRPSRSP